MCSSDLERGQKSALHKVKSITESVNFAVVDLLMALYQKYNGEYADVIIPKIIDLEQTNYLRVVFKKETGKNELRDNVNAMLETFAKIKINEKCILTQLAEKYKFSSFPTNVSDFIITDFETNGAENGGEGSPSNPETNGAENGDSNTVPVPPTWL